ncbi:long-chain fatty acid--CoA ligase [Massilia sp. Root418]|uniref:AMP-binding protein n=1 Tax=Massilia sp. Root418 TaxID=1736532 RepID=UPI0006FDB127|nr:AMP-binding protein [Massilia sp. Root418]KQW93165.1 long-chain fatty acid--CoA ligase [Massilia sp. Root418]
MNPTFQPWQSTYRKHRIPATIDPDAYPSVVALMEQAMRHFAERVAFRSEGRAMTYASLDRQSAAFAAWLREKIQVEKGARIAVMLPNILAFPIATLGIMRAGAVQVNVNPMYTARELEHQLKDCGAEIIVAWNESSAVLASVIAGTKIKMVILADAHDSEYPAPTKRPEQQFGVPTLAFFQALAAGAGLARVTVPLTGDDPLFLQYTGGTSGVSKGAILSHRNLLANIEQFKAMYAAALEAGEDRIVTAIPMYHIFALMLNFLAYFSFGAENWLISNPRDVDKFIDVLKEAKATVFVGVNTLYASLVQHHRIGEVDFAALRLSIGGGAAVLGAVATQWQAVTGTFIREGYGLTETSPVVTFTPASATRFSGNTGLPMPGTDVRVLGDDGHFAGPGGIGEICVKGPQVMCGYWQQPEANALAFTPDGYFKTGDIGVFNADGFLSIVDRKKDMVIVSGFNVYPNEVEAVVSAMPGVAECACVGTPDARTGEALVLFVVGLAGSDLSEKAVTAHCRSLLTAYKVPKTIRIVDRLPKSSVGKILRRALTDSL